MAKAARRKSPRKSSPETNVSILISDEYLDRISLVVRDLKSAGFTVSDIHRMLGSVSGSVHRDQIAAVRKVRGVSAVEESREYQIAPPDSEVQ